VPSDGARIVSPKLPLSEDKPLFVAHLLISVNGAKTRKKNLEFLDLSQLLIFLSLKNRHSFLVIILFPGAFRNIMMNAALGRAKDGEGWTRLVEPIFGDLLG
jgi:hypothetical protein